MPEADEQPEVRRTLFPPHWASLGLLVEFALNHWAPVAKFIPAPWNLLGIGVIASGFVLVVSAFRLFAKAKTGIKPFSASTTLVAEGPYRFTRNPMYLGMAAILFGTAISLGTFTPFLGVAAFVVLITVRFIFPEEAHMERAFGARYLDFKSRSRRWI